MNDIAKKNAQNLRKQHNSDLIRRMRNGESLNAIDSKASWFPPRPVIEKDRSEMARLYQEAQDQANGLHAVKKDDKIVPFTLPETNAPLGEAS